MRSVTAVDQIWFRWGRNRHIDFELYWILSSEFLTVHASLSPVAKLELTYRNTLELTHRNVVARGEFCKASAAENSIGFARKPAERRL